MPVFFTKCNELAMPHPLGLCVRAEFKVVFVAQNLLDSVSFNIVNVAILEAIIVA